MHVSLLAHQGGWDEALFVIGPLLFIVFLLRTAKNRALKAQQDRLDLLDGQAAAATPTVPPTPEP
ncbi:MAG: hypothetical protein JWM34_4528 [Ilumatobacteraceae bacterium]|nr:hypothetical protein [Ilumatobacteraceae bacterium]